MVRFIIKGQLPIVNITFEFTFHYGQIYYLTIGKALLSYPTVYIPLWLDLLSEILNLGIAQGKGLHSTMVRFIIKKEQFADYSFLLFTFHYGQIYYILNLFIFIYIPLVYIPLWLDLLFASASLNCRYLTSLHSTMVRFIILYDRDSVTFSTEFTFHYGQIYYI